MKVVVAGLVSCGDEESGFLIGSRVWLFHNTEARIVTITHYQSTRHCVWCYIAPDYYNDFIAYIHLLSAESSDTFESVLRKWVGNDCVIAQTLRDRFFSANELLRAIADDCVANYIPLRSSVSNALAIVVESPMTPTLSLADLHADELELCLRLRNKNTTNTGKHTSKDITSVDSHHVVNRLYSLYSGTDSTATIKR